MAMLVLVQCLGLLLPTCRPGGLVRCRKELTQYMSMPLIVVMAMVFSQQVALPHVLQAAGHMREAVPRVQPYAVLSQCSQAAG